MALMTITSPHAHGQNSTGKLMLTVSLATIPGLLVMTAFFGWGTLINVVLSITTCLVTEALILKSRGRPITFTLSDNTAVLTGVLLGLALPPLGPWWITVLASAFSICFAKQMYGGLGNNPFNPAMVGYALVLISFPVEMTTTWAASVQLTSAPFDVAALFENFSTSVSAIFASSQPAVDALSGATPLDVYKNMIANKTSSQVLQEPVFNGWLNSGWEWMNMAFFAGGLYLIWKKIISWHIPFSILIALTLCSAILGWDDDMYTPTSLHLLSGATMLGAFFIATDPVSASTTPVGKIIYGAGIGILTYVIRTWGAYPDAIAFAVLLMNFAAPFIDAYTQPRTYGHKKAKRGLIAKG